MTAIRDRIVELRRVPASELVADPRNWRRHPPAQQRALRSVLAEVGYADALLARQTAEGLVLIDGHLRAETTPDEVVPVLVLDINEDEAAMILATLDPLAGMAIADSDALAALLASVTISDDELLAHLREMAGIRPVAEGLTDPDDLPPVPAEPRTRPATCGSWGSTDCFAPTPATLRPWLACSTAPRSTWW